MGKLVIDEETGEVETQINPGDRIIRGKSIEFLDSVEVWEIEHFYKGNIDELRLINKELSIYARGILFTLLPYISYVDCCLKYDNGNCLTTSDIESICGVSRSKLFEILEELKSKDIIYRGKNSKETQFFINPWIVCRGNRINKVLRTMFQNYRVRIVGKKWKDIPVDVKKTNRKNTKY